MSVIEIKCAKAQELANLHGISYAVVWLDNGDDRSVMVLREESLDTPEVTEFDPVIHAIYSPDSASRV